MDEIEVFKALSNPTRVKMLTWLKDPEVHFEEGSFCSNGVCVGAIQKKSGLTQSTVSEYLSVLQRAKLIASTRSGQWTYYKRNEETVQELSTFIKSDL
ncbi:MAG: helix-turn-helix transcriptional regulator [Mucilaginibacter polytrichastri]|nr:helix-turn-helix transcriptional regulator [Mucilaginibacter polytrichastri]